MTTTTRVITQRRCTSNRWEIILLLLVALAAITLIDGAEDGDDDQQQTKPYCSSDGANGVHCISFNSSSSSSSIFNLSAALADYASKNCSSELIQKSDDNLNSTCDHQLENLFISGDLENLSSLSTGADFGGLSFASVHLYPSTSGISSLLTSFTCSPGSQLSKQVFFSGRAAPLSSEGASGLLGSCTSLQQVEFALNDSSPIDLCSLGKRMTSLEQSSLRQLEYLVFRRPSSEGTTGYTISDYAFSCLFSLAQLKVLKLGRNAIKSIAPDGFSIREEQVDRVTKLAKDDEYPSLLTVNLDNCQLTDDTLREVRLDRIAGARRPVQLMLGKSFEHFLRKIS